jgi:hypothetical protein
MSIVAAKHSYAKESGSSSLSQIWWLTQFRRLAAAQKKGAQRMVQDAEVFARGAIRHDDHRTIRLAGWHKALMNTEHQAAAMRHVAFLD